MKFLKDFDFTNKRVLLRTDFNVPLGNDGIVDGKEDWRIEATLPTINYLLGKKAKIILLSHLGRPKGKVVESLRLEPVRQRLENLLGQKVLKSNGFSIQEIEKSAKNLQAGEIVLLENIRFHPGERNNDPNFARQLANLGEIYVNDAFGSIHRSHASIVGLPQYLSSCAGLLLEKEIKVLSQIAEKPERPLLVIIGGIKISTKIKVIKSFLEKTDALILGGALANTVISAKGFAIGKSIIEKEMVEEVKKLELTNIKLHIPVDAVVSVNSSGGAPSRIAPIGKTNGREMILDIGPETIQLFSQVISQAKTIIWNGPVGIFEVEKFNQGSKKIARAIAQSDAFSVVGGGETITLLEQMGLLEKINHISTGGGAMLKFLAGEKLPGIEALK